MHSKLINLIISLLVDIVTYRTHVFCATTLIIPTAVSMTGKTCDWGNGWTKWDVPRQHFDNPAFSCPVGRNPFSSSTRSLLVGVVHPRPTPAPYTSIMKFPSSDIDSVEAILWPFWNVVLKSTRSKRWPTYLYRWGTNFYLRSVIFLSHSNKMSCDKIFSRFWQSPKITVTFTRTHHLSPSWARWIQSILTFHYFNIHIHIIIIIIIPLCCICNWPSGCWCSTLIIKNWIIPSMSRSSKFSLPFRYSDYKFLCIPHIPHAP
jgi:hypothetical protein